MIVAWAADIVAIVMTAATYRQRPAESLLLLVLVGVVAGVASLDNSSGSDAKARPGIAALSIAAIVTALLVAAIAYGSVPGLGAGWAR